MSWCSGSVAPRDCCRVLLPHLSPVVIDGIDRADDAVVVAAHGRSRGSRCRGCSRVSTRVNSRYQRRVADLPAAGRPVVLCLTVRRFFCDHVDCPAGTFVEQVPGVTERKRPPQHRPAGCVDSYRVGAGRAGWFPAGRKTGHGSEPVDAAPRDPRAAGSPGRSGHGARCR